jgi:hypothetical protein
VVWIQGLGVRVQGFRVWGLGFKGLGFRVLGFGFGYRVYGLES